MLPAPEFLAIQIGAKYVDFGNAKHTGESAHLSPKYGKSGIYRRQSGYFVRLDAAP